MFTQMYKNRNIKLNNMKQMKLLRLKSYHSFLDVHHVFCNTFKLFGWNKVLSKTVRLECQNTTVHKGEVVVLAYGDLKLT